MDKDPDDIPIVDWLKKRGGPVADLRARIAALESQLAQYRWRRVEEEMPPTETEVLLYLAPWVWGDPMMTGFLDEGSFVVHGYGSGHRVLAWMPLPPAPQEE